MNLIDAREKRSELLAEAEGLNKTAETESRALNIDEATRFDTIMKEVETINQEIERQEKLAQEGRKIENTKTIKPEVMEKRSLVGLLADAVQTNKGKVNLSEARALTATGGAADAVATSTEDIITALEKELVATKLGARFITGIQDNEKFPVMPSFDAGFVSENGEAPTNDKSMTAINLSPKRISTQVPVSKTLLLQENVGVEAQIRKSIVSAIRQALEAKMFSKAAKTSDAPAGLLNGMTAVDSGAAIDFEKVVELEGAVDAANALDGNLAYVTNSKGRSALKVAKKDAGSGRFVMEGNEANGYNVVRTNHLPNNYGTGTNETPLVFGNFADLAIAQWGDIEVIVDPYTLAANNQVRLVVNANFDFAKLRPESFQYSTFTV